MSHPFRIPFPKLPSSATCRSAGIYTSGALFSLGFWFFVDAAVCSKVHNPSDVHIHFPEWIPLICSVLGMLIINSIEKSRLTGDRFSYSVGDGDVVWKAKLVLFMGLALVSGGLAGSVCFLILGYIVPDYPWPTLYFGVANVLANSLIALSCVSLWLSQNIEEEYTYSLSL
ncbi:uncharacterized protein H6S33_012349 [Morchella sextelata]|uniref:uncharacterized protein n=1 Tax=Morchella sextelata TaxID=1174677 RepID=UPI001D055941|nr:uncharacterized protein H6S33_012349 [Morchella sextelata]KAH0609803.1 hypothetical protein H6S33_012349 [Morchella sextelata]